MSVTDKPIALQEFFSEPSPQSCGAVASFVGIVRNHDHGRAVKFLYYDCYRFMAEKVMRTIVEEALNRWDVEKVQVSHRVGRLGIGDVAVAISVSAAHRAEAFEACRFVIEEIKERVPIWKREIFEDGTSEWVSCAHAETHG
ncbi:MAG: molybdenum cofactor biosynthesis protein MoaE [Candidatus Omnitrophica bacterium]|nr:molybdenum cofactor biosynthesis protein MoaE [Candidatus Omnitrophota bacterium]